MPTCPAMNLKGVLLCKAEATALWCSMYLLAASVICHHCVLQEQMTSGRPKFGSRTLRACHCQSELLAVEQQAQVSEAMLTDSVSMMSSRSPLSDGSDNITSSSLQHKVLVIHVREVLSRPIRVGVHQGRDPARQ